SFVQRLRRLDLSYNPLGDGGIAILARSGVLEGITDLDLSQCAMTMNGLRELLAGEEEGEGRPSLPAIRRLDLSFNYDFKSSDNGEEAVRQLAAWEGGAELEHLLLRGWNVTKEAREKLLASPRRSALRDVIIESNGVPP